MNILLFDVDGVLIEDRGYQAAINATLKYFGRLMGAGHIALDDATRELFHAHGYTNEWDLCPFAIGVMIVEALKAAPELKLRSEPLENFLKQFNVYRATSLPYAGYVARTEQTAGRPAERALAVLRHELSSIKLIDDSRAAAESILYTILADPYRVATATVTQVFQEHVLGSSAFEETYHLPPRFNVSSLLFDEDRSLLKPQARHTLIRLAAAPQSHLCVYTARPSLPPTDDVNWLLDAHRRPTGYSPEAELAVQVAGLEDYPLIAMGRMQWLAARVKQPVEYLTKPAPVQAFAAIGAAISQRESAALIAAYALVSRGEVIAPLATLIGQSIDVWVVEDAVLGLHAARGAIELLPHFGIDARLHGIGISSGGPKAAALAPLCEVIVKDVNEAIDSIAHAVG
jgi:hypothetical protein